MPLPRRLRSVLFAPAVRPDLIAKMPATGADAIVIDLEDATPPQAKQAGRVNLAALLPDLAHSTVFARINDATTPWYRADLAALAAISAAGSDLAAVVVPKIETLAGLDALQSDLAVAGLDLPVIAGVETARGVADARELLAHRVIAACYFGAEDFIADMGGVRTSNNAEVQVARSLVALAARLANVPAIDQIVTDFRDDERCRRECLDAKASGFAGKLCVHPAQVAIANDSFTPSAAEIDRARRLLAAYETATSNGVASIAFEGRMVDEPVAVQARGLLAQADDP